MICMFQGTSCRPRAAAVLHGICPDCGDNLQPRPTRPPVALERQ